MDFRHLVTAVVAIGAAMPAASQPVFDDDPNLLGTVRLRDLLVLQGVAPVDGDTINLNGTRWRLWGIDAPEMAQTCKDGWAAGVEAKGALERLMDGASIHCELKDTDRYGRSVGICRADGRDLGAAMVSAGMAWAFTRYSSDYVGQERAAIGAGIGVHTHDCEKPWDWRRKRPLGDPG
jgi:endonuclease YncB( thermonuclease family)